MKSVTISIRIKPYLRQELESLSANTGHGIDWFIEQALQEYLNRRRKTLRLEEALRDVEFLRGKEESNSI